LAWTKFHSRMWVQLYPKWYSREVRDFEKDYRELISASITAPTKELRDAATEKLKAV
jgi:hypothetical protein